MKTFQKKNWFFAIGWIPFIAIGIMPKVNEEDNTLIIISFLLFAVGYEVPRKEQRKRNLIRAEVRDWRTVQTNCKNYETILPFKYEGDINSLPHIWKRNMKGEFEKRTQFEKGKFGYTIRDKEETSSEILDINYVVAEDNICIFEPNTIVFGYMKKGHFVVVS